MVKALDNPCLPEVPEIWLSQHHICEVRGLHITIHILLSVIYSNLVTLLNNSQQVLIDLTTHVSRSIQSSEQTCKMNIAVRFQIYHK